MVEAKRKRKETNKQRGQEAEEGVCAASGMGEGREEPVMKTRANLKMDKERLKRIVAREKAETAKRAIEDEDEDGGDTNSSDGEVKPVKRPKKSRIKPEAVVRVFKGTGAKSGGAVGAGGNDYISVGLKQLEEDAKSKRIEDEELIRKLNKNGMVTPENLVSKVAVQVGSLVGEGLTAGAEAMEDVSDEWSGSGTSGDESEEGGDGQSVGAKGDEAKCGAEGKGVTEGLRSAKWTGDGSDEGSTSSEGEEDDENGSKGSSGVGTDEEEAENQRLHRSRQDDGEDGAEWDVTEAMAEAQSLLNKAKSVKEKRAACRAAGGFKSLAKLRAAVSKSADDEDDLGFPPSAATVAGVVAAKLMLASARSLEEKRGACEAAEVFPTLKMDVEVERRVILRMETAVKTDQRRQRRMKENEEVERKAAVAMLKVEMLKKGSKKRKSSEKSDAMMVEDGGSNSSGNILKPAKWKEWVTLEEYVYNAVFDWLPEQTEGGKREKPAKVVEVNCVAGMWLGFIKKVDGVWVIVSESGMQKWINKGGSKDKKLVTVMSWDEDSDSRLEIFGCSITTLFAGVDVPMGEQCAAGVAGSGAQLHTKKGEKPRKKLKTVKLSLEAIKKKFEKVKSGAVSDRGAWHDVEHSGMEKVWFVEDDGGDTAGGCVRRGLNRTAAKHDTKVMYSGAAMEHAEMLNNVPECMFKGSTSEMNVIIAREKHSAAQFGVDIGAMRNGRDYLDGALEDLCGIVSVENPEALEELRVGLCREIEERDDMLTMVDGQRWAGDTIGGSEVRMDTLQKLRAGAQANDISLGPDICKLFGSGCVIVQCGRAHMSIAEFKTKVEDMEQVVVILVVGEASGYGIAKIENVKAMLAQAGWLGDDEGDGSSGGKERRSKELLHWPERGSSWRSEGDGQGEGEPSKSSAKRSESRGVSKAAGVDGEGSNGRQEVAKKERVRVPSFFEEGGTRSVSAERSEEAERGRSNSRREDKRSLSRSKSQADRGSEQASDLGHSRSSSAARGSRVTPADANGMVIVPRGTDKSGAQRNSEVMDRLKAARNREMAAWSGQGEQGLLSRGVSDAERSMSRDAGSRSSSRGGFNEPRLGAVQGGGRGSSEQRGAVGPRDGQVRRGVDDRRQQGSAPAKAPPIYAIVIERSSSEWLCRIDVVKWGLLMAEFEAMPAQVFVDPWNTETMYMAVLDCEHLQKAKGKEDVCSRLQLAMFPMGDCGVKIVGWFVMVCGFSTTGEKSLVLMSSRDGMTTGRGGNKQQLNGVFDCDGEIDIYLEALGGTGDGKLKPVKAKIVRAFHFGIDQMRLYEGDTPLGTINHDGDQYERIMRHVQSAKYGAGVALLWAESNWVKKFIEVLVLPLVEHYVPILMEKQKKENPEAYASAEGVTVFELDAKRGNFVRLVKHKGSKLLHMGFKVWFKNYCRIAYLRKLANDDNGNPTFEQVGQPEIEMSKMGAEDIQRGYVYGLYNASYVECIEELIGWSQEMGPELLGVTVVQPNSVPVGELVGQTLIKVVSLPGGCVSVSGASRHVCPGGSLLCVYVKTELCGVECDSSSVTDVQARADGGGNQEAMDERDGEGNGNVPKQRMGSDSRGGGRDEGRQGSEKKVRQHKSSVEAASVGGAETVGGITVGGVRVMSGVGYPVCQSDRGDVEGAGVLTCVGKNGEMGGYESEEAAFVGVTGECHEGCGGRFSMGGDYGTLACKHWDPNSEMSKEAAGGEQQDDNRVAGADALWQAVVDGVNGRKEALLMNYARQCAERVKIARAEEAAVSSAERGEEAESVFMTPCKLGDSADAAEGKGESTCEKTEGRSTDQRIWSNEAGPRVADSMSAGHIGRVQRVRLVNEEVHMVDLCSVAVRKGSGGEWSAQLEEVFVREEAFNSVMSIDVPEWVGSVDEWKMRFNWCSMSKGDVFGAPECLLPDSEAKWDVVDAFEESEVFPDIIKSKVKFLGIGSGVGEESESLVVLLAKGASSWMVRCVSSDGCGLVLMSAAMALWQFKEQFEQMEEALSSEAVVACVFKLEKRDELVQLSKQWLRESDREAHRYRRGESE